MRSKITTFLFVLILLAGLSLLLYPTASNYWNSFHATVAVSSYRETADSLSRKRSEAILAAAERYNAELSENGQDYRLSSEERAQYESALNIDGTGMMGYLEIPAIDLELPVYHGTEESVLQSAVGHLEWTSLPVGGESTHCVLSGHRGLPSAKLFTDLDRLTAGDTFTVTVLNRTVTYEVDTIQTVLPEEVDTLRIQEGKDLCTLVTCTPYGINTHRLLVQGHRVENGKKPVQITSEAAQVEPVMVVPFVALPLMFVAFTLMRQIDRKRNREEGAVIDETDQE